MVGVDFGGGTHQDSLLELQLLASSDKLEVIAIVTGNCFEQDKRELMSPNLSCRANYFYRKPLKMSDCENLVRDILGKNFSYAKSEPLIRPKSIL